MMYHVTYLSGTCKVKGYLALPNGFDIPVPALQQFVCSFYDCSDLSVTKIATSLSLEKKDIRSTKLSVFLYCRGGIGKVGKVKTTWIEQFANHGYIVFAPCYRGNEGGEGRDEFGGAENEDVISAYHFLQHLPFVKSERMSIMGFSRGAINAAQTVANISSIHRLILWGGVSDLKMTYTERIDLRRMLKRVLNGTPNKTPLSYENRSPIQIANQIHCPTLIMHGTEDVQVDFSHGLTMYNRLKELGTKVVMHSYEGYGHHLPEHIHKKALDRMFQWIEQIQ
ncbi:prolyl oligopeptidase family serine peptidase [Bacillus sp. 165]|uniref:alpha/beta hydrolase family protein n=1 Tax=Bacillus sp. 165 TaxID=1529117 RepID=UPI001ADA881C|nr:prolyl oligopeptidase family serine peptidase [Bacillus sp. 165]MBO9128989.1 S9 family peptidase [Bacillus sp. 165]